MAYIIETPNPFEPLTNIRKHIHEGGITIRQWLDLTKPGFTEFQFPTICMVNGQGLLRAHWDYVIQEKDIVNFITVPGEPITLIIISVVIAVAAVAVTIALSSALPKTPGALPASDPVFTIKGQQNQARLGEPIEVNYGRNRIYPSLAARPYPVYNNNNQYLHILMCVGQGAHLIDNIQIGETPIENFHEASYQIAQPGERITLFPTQVFTSLEAGGQTLFAPNDTVNYVAPGYVGPFAVCPSGDQINNIEFDFTFPKGLYIIQKSGKMIPAFVDFEVEAQEIDDTGAAIGSWFSIVSPTPYRYLGRTITPQRVTLLHSVTLGRYQVRMRRTSGDFEILFPDNSVGNEIQWDGLRGLLAGTTDYGNVTMLAVRVQATNNLNDRSAVLFNCVALRKLSTNRLGTGLTATRSIVWAFVDVFRATYGAKVTEAYFDWDTLEALDTYLEGRSLYFDWTFRDPITVWEAAQAIARAGRAVPLIAGSLITMRRDDAETIPVTAFGPDNIVQGTFEWQVNLWAPLEFDSIRAEYTEVTSGYKQETVLVTLPGGTTNNPQDVRYLGVQDRNRAYQLALYDLAIQRYRRQNFTFETGLEGYIPGFNDLVALSIDLTKGGQSGYIVDAIKDSSGSFWRLTVSEPLLTGTAAQMLLRSRTGGTLGPFGCAVLDQQTVRLDTSSDIDFLLDGMGEPMIFLYGTAELANQSCRVASVEPQGGERMRITLVNDDARIYSYDTDTGPVFTGGGPTQPSGAPAVTGLVLSQVAGTLQVLSSWISSPGAIKYQVESSTDGINWRLEGITTDTHYNTVAATDGEYFIRVSAIGTGGKGLPTTAEIVLVAPARTTQFYQGEGPPGDDLGFTGDTYLDILTGCIYEKIEDSSENGIWVERWCPAEVDSSGHPIVASIYQVDSIADLVALPSAYRNGPIEVLGYYGPTTPGGGTFYWDYTSTETENLGTIFAVPTVGTGRWKRMFVRESPAHVTWWGAKADGSTDDSPACQAAIDFCSTSSAHNTVYVPTGLYALTTGLVVPAGKPITIKGDDMTGFFDPSGPLQGAHFDYHGSGIALKSSAYRLHLEDLRFTSTSNADYGVCTTGEELYIFRVNIGTEPGRGFKTGLYMNNSSISTLRDLILSCNTVHAMWLDCSTAVLGTEGACSSMILDRVHFYNSPIGLRMGVNATVNIWGSWWESCQLGVYATNDSTANGILYNITISGCQYLQNPSAPPAFYTQGRLLKIENTDNSHTWTIAGFRIEKCHIENIGSDYDIECAFGSVVPSVSTFVINEINSFGASQAVFISDTASCAPIIYNINAPTAAKIVDLPGEAAVAPFVVHGPNANLELGERTRQSILRLVGAYTTGRSVFIQAGSGSSDANAALDVVRMDTSTSRLKRLGLWADITELHGELNLYNTSDQISMRLVASGGINYLQVGLNSGDTTAALVVTRKDTADNPLASLTVFSVDTIINSTSLELQTTGASSGFRLVPNSGGVNYIQIGTGSGDTNAQLVICRRDTSIGQLKQVDLYSDLSVIHGTTRLGTLTANRVLTLDGSLNITVSSTTDVELAYVHGVTSNIQAQLDSITTDVSTLDAVIVGLGADVATLFSDVAARAVWPLVDTDLVGFSSATGPFQNGTLSTYEDVVFPDGGSGTTAETGTLVPGTYLIWCSGYMSDTTAGESISLRLYDTHAAGAIPGTEKTFLTTANVAVDYTAMAKVTIPSLGSGKARLQMRSVFGLNAKTWYQSTTFSWLRIA